MIEAIESNKRRSLVLVVLMAVLLVALGFAIGEVVEPGAGAVGAAAAALVWFLLWGVALVGGDGIFLASSGARQLSREDSPRLWNVVEEMTIASGLGRMPDVYLVDDPMPNAFAVGRNPQKTGAVAVTSGLLRMLDRDELQGVVGHEIGHLKNRDTRFMVLAGVMLGAIVVLADVFLRGFLRGRRRRSSSRGGGGAEAAIVLIAILFAILAPILARLLYFACSRRREYLADASSARFTRYPEGLASALEKMVAQRGLAGEVNRVLAPMYIINPSQALSLFSTHPPPEERITILRGMAGGAGFVNYEEAYRKLKGRECIGARTLRGDETPPVRPPSREEDDRREAVGRAREVHDVLARAANFVTFACACGMTIRSPEGLKKDAVGCPRCGAVTPVPAERGERYVRKSKGWESFRCSCGRAVQLAPSFAAPHVVCGGCGRKIEVAARSLSD